jgi:putative FmdB family regulatory protein
VRCRLPIYEYQCGECGAVFERRQTFDAEPVAICPKCQSKARRVIHSVPIVFKGSGFYCTDHGRGSRTIDSRRDGDKESRPEAPAEAKSESKPKAKAKADSSSTTAAVTEEV